MPLARDLMTTTILTVEPALTLSELDAILLREQISGAPVVENGQLVGIVSRSDVVRALSAVQESTAEVVADYYEDPPFRGVSASAALPREAEVVGRRMAELRVGEVMSRNLIHVSPDATAGDVAKELLRHGVHRLLVTEHGKLVGLISALDLVRLVADDGA